MASSSRRVDDDMGERKDVTKPTELKLSPPKHFTGKRDEFDRFLQDVLLYLDVNEEIYNTDKKKIAFALSFMDQGDAESWKGQFLLSATTSAGLDLGTWSKFLNEIQAAFKPYDAPGDALEELSTLRMGNCSIEDHIAKFRRLASKAGVKDDMPPAIDYFRKSLNIPLQRNLMSLPTPLVTLKDWFEWATRLDNNYQKMQRIFNRNPKKKEEPKRHWQFQRKEKDPNAMDVDAMSIDKRTEMMRKGLCFGCGKPGHLSRDCPEKKKPSTSSSSSSSPPSYTPPKKMNAKELYSHIRSLTTLMTEEEKEEFYEEAEKEGF